MLGLMFECIVFQLSNLLITFRDLDRMLLLVSGQLIAHLHTRLAHLFLDASLDSLWRVQKVFLFGA